MKRRKRRERPNRFVTNKGHMHYLTKVEELTSRMLFGHERREARRLLMTLLECSALMMDPEPPTHYKDGRRVSMRNIRKQYQEIVGPMPEWMHDKMFQ